MRKDSAGTPACYRGAMPGVPAYEGPAIALLQPAEAGYIGGEEGVRAMRPRAVLTAAIAMLALAVPAGAATKKPPVVERSASGTVIQPTTTIIHDGYGHTTVIVIPRRRSYLDTGTEVSVGDRGYMDYMLPPGGDPGRPNWFYGPDYQGHGRYPLPSAFDGTGINPNTPF